LSEAEYFKAYYGNLDTYSDTIKDARLAGELAVVNPPALLKP
jgi:hypothetical protein